MQTERIHVVRKLSVAEHLTVDGVMQAPGGPEEDREGGFKYGGWAMNYSDDRLGDTIMRWMQNMGGLLLGRKTYDIFASYWPNVKPLDPGADIAELFNRLPKYVASRTLDKASWNNTTILQGDVCEGVAQLKRQDGGEIQMWGSGELVRTLLKADLVDELLLLRYPVILGSGKRLFQGNELPIALKVEESYQSPKGATVTRYERDGDIKLGTMAEPTEAGAR
jgi:dihydrofolate reductase